MQFKSSKMTYIVSGQGAGPPLVSPDLFLQRSVWVVKLSDFVSYGS